MATRTYNAIDKTIDGLKLEEFDEAIEQLAKPFNNEEIYSAGRYVTHNNCIYQKIEEPKIRNLFKRPYPIQLSTGNEVEIDGVTWTINNDGSITADGEAENDSVFELFLNLVIPQNKYMLSGCPENGSSSTYYEFAVLRINGISNPMGRADYGGGVIIPNLNINYMSIELIIKSGYTANNLIFYPQLELGTSITPYQQPGRLNDEFIESQWRLIKEL